ncbi:hypothetical protein LINPERHAP1_LOCUS30375 [Linum perenne]
MAAYIESWRTLEHEEVHLQGDMWILLEVQKGDLGQAIGSATIHVADKCRTPANGCEAHHSSRGTYHRQLKGHSSGKLQGIQQWHGSTFDSKSFIQRDSKKNTGAKIVSVYENVRDNGDPVNVVAGKEAEEVGPNRWGITSGFLLEEDESEGLPD